MSNGTVKQMIAQLRQAYKSGDAKMVRRIQVMLDYSRGESATAIADRHGIGVSSVYAWLQQLLAGGVDSLKPRWKGGRPAKLTRQQKKELGDLLDAGPEAAGFGSACWNSALIQELIHQRFGKLYNVHYVCELLKQLGYSFQKARFVSDHLDEAKRREWLTHTWPSIQKQAKTVGAWLLFGDEASFAQWGSLSYTWARKGQQPLVKTSGKRKAYKTFGLIDYFSGRFFYQGIDGRFTADSYITFLSQVLAQTSGTIFLVQDGARYHTAKKTRQFFAQQAARLTVYQLPSYSPDYNPIEYLWRNVKKAATHLKYFPTFAVLAQTVQKTLADFQQQPERIQVLFGLYLKRMADPDGQSLTLAA